MSEAKCLPLFELEFSREGHISSKYTEREKTKYFWRIYSALLVFNIFITAIGSLITSTILPNNSTPWVIFPLAIFLLHIVVVVSGRNGLIYYKEELDGDTLVITTGYFKPRYYFQKVSKPN